MKEAELLSLIEAGAFDRAATQTLGFYGPEVYGFLVGFMGCESDASEVFLQLGEDLWKGLPGFGGRSSLRTWLYVLARNAAAEYRRSPWNRSDRRVHEAELGEILARTRTTTSPWLRTDVKDQVRALRESLDPEDRAILVLRVDRQLSWEDVARITLGAHLPEELALKREVARVTKRYQRIKEQLKKRARESGLFDGKE